MKTLNAIIRELNDAAAHERMKSTAAITRRYKEKIAALKEAHYKKYKNEGSAKLWCKQNNNKFHWCDKTRVVFDAGGGQVWTSWPLILDYLLVHEEEE